MSLAMFVPILLKTSIALNVFCLGLVSSAPLAYLIRNPALLLRSLVAMIVIMPLLAIILAVTFNLHPAVKIALLTLALSPVPPKMPQKAQHAAGSAAYAVALLVAASVLSIAWVPLGVEFIGRIFGFPIHMGPGPVVGLVSMTILGPLLLGMLVARFLPELHPAIIRALTIVSTVLLIAAVAPILFRYWHAIVSFLQTGTLTAILAFIVVGLTAGHFLGGPSERNRSVLAVSTAFRHPGIAIAIATSTFPGQKSAPAAIIVYLLVGAVASQLYERWMSRRQARPSE